MGFLSDLAARLDPLTEARPNKSSAHNVKPELAPPKASDVRRAGYEYGIQIGGTSASTQDAFAQERLQILNQLYQSYLTCPWVSGPIDLIARTATAGGLDIVVDDLDDHEGTIPADPPAVTRLRRLMKFTNMREDMVQLLRSAAIDLLLFGDSYIEVVRLLGEPVALYTLDATTMTVLCDEHGEVTGYKQSVDGIRSAMFDPEDVIHVSLDAPRGGVYGVSPAQKALLPVTAWLFTEATIKECFRRGDPPRIHVDLGSMKELDVQRWRERYTVNNLGPKAVGAPIITTGGGIVNPVDPRKVQDYLDASRQLRDEIISCFGTPPSKLGIIEAGNIGGAGTAEGQDKTFRINTIVPVQALILEKMNYHLVQVGFGITGWHLEFGEVDMRDSKVVEDIRDTRLRNGAYCVDEQTEILTEKGWKTYDQLIAGDQVYTLNHDEGVAEWQECQEVHVFEPAPRMMTRMQMRGHSSFTTTNHRWPTEAYTAGSKVQQWKRRWTTSENLTYWDRLITAAPSGDRPVESVYDDAFVELVAWFWTEGHAPKRNRFVTITQKKPEGVARIRAALEKMYGPAYERSRYHRKTDSGVWIERVSKVGTSSFRLAAAVGQDFRNVVDDHVVSQDFLLSLTQEQLDLFIEVSLLADGNNAASGQRVLGQKRRAAAEAFQLACILAGYSATLRERVTTSGRYVGYRMWMVNVNETTTVSPIKAARTSPSAMVEVVEYDGVVWCPKTANKSWMARRDGTVYFTGNTLNRYRDEIGEPPVEGGDDPVLIDRQNIVLWSNMDALSQAGIAYKLKGTALEPGDPQPGQPLNIQKPEQPDVIPMPQQPQPGQPAQPASAAGDPLPSPGPSTGPDAKLPAKDRPGGKGDAAQGKGPRETLDVEVARLTEAWLGEYLGRHRRAMESMTPVPVADKRDLPEAPQVEPKEGDLPTDPYWEADAHNHNDKPDYEPAELGLEVLNRFIMNPADLNYDHEHYQRPVDQRLIDKYTQEPRQKLAARVGLVGIRSDGTAWCIDGQHHSLAAVREHITELTYQSFPSTGWPMEKQVYDRFHAWHKALHGKEVDLVHGGVAPDIPESSKPGVYGPDSSTPLPPRRRPKRKKRR